MEGKATKIKMGLTIVFMATLVTGVLIGKGWDRAVMATRQAVFPLHGLDVYFD